MSYEATIVLIAEGMLFLYVLLDGIRSLKRHSRPSLIPLILMILGVLLIMVVLYRGQELKGGDYVQILLMIGLVTITAVYASSTERMARANVKKAEEMRDARYDAVRPVIDIVIIEQSITPREGLLQAYGASPKDLPCKLRNVGVGPAIAVHSFIEDIHDPDGNPRRWDFGTLPSAAGKMEYTQEMRLLLMQKDNQRALVAYYEDVYGNRFESIREVNVHEVVRSKGPIKIRKMAEKESRNDS